MSGHKNTTKPRHKDQRTSSSRHWNQCELVIHLKKTNKNKEDNFFSKRLFSKWSPSRPPGTGCQAGPHLERTPFHGRATHPRSPSEGDMPSHQCSSRAHLWNVGGHQSPRRKTMQGRENVWTPYSAPGWKSFFFSPPHQWYDETRLKETMLFQDLL